MDNMVYKIVEEELEDAKKKILSRMRGFVKDGNQAWAPRNMKLLFKNRISQVILTGEEIRGQGRNPLEVVLVDESTGNIVDAEPESSATIEILLLKGEPNAYEGDDWTVKQFSENIVRETEQEKPLLAGNQCIKLQNGIGFLVNIKLRHHATKMRPSVFKLGARVINTFHGVCIMEARTESFVVKDFRSKYYIKHETPSLSDEVFRLKNIRRGGKIEKCLQDRNIQTVENFLIQHLIDPQGLKNADAEDLLESACKNWEKVEPFEDENSIQHHFNDVGGHDNAQTCEINFPLMSETGVGDCSLFSTDDMEIISRGFLPRSPMYALNFDTLSKGFDLSFEQN